MSTSRQEASINTFDLSCVTYTIEGGQKDVSSQEGHHIKNICDCHDYQIYNKSKVLSNQQLKFFFFFFFFFF